MHDALHLVGRQRLGAARLEQAAAQLPAAEHEHFAAPLAVHPPPRQREYRRNPYRLPAGFRPTIGSESDTLTGRRTPSSELGSPYEAVDLAAYDGPIELRVWVYIEQAFTPVSTRSTTARSGR